METIHGALNEAARKHDPALGFVLVSEDTIRVELHKTAVATIRVGPPE